MKPLIHFGLIALTAVHVAAETLTIPQGAETRENVFNSSFPFSIPGDISSQQVFSSALFPALSQPGQAFQIDGMAFRLGSQGTFGGGTAAAFDRVEILLSSSLGPFTLDLERNHGANMQVVYDGPLTLSGAVPAGTMPSLFDLQIGFGDSFIYDPSRGALVIEIRKYGSAALTTVIGASDAPGTTFFQRNASGTESFGNIGPETLLNYQIVPEPRVEILFFVGLLGLMARLRKRS